jgi:hypothetical protein
MRTPLFVAAAINRPAYRHGLCADGANRSWASKRKNPRGAVRPPRIAVARSGRDYDSVAIAVAVAGAIAVAVAVASVIVAGGRGSERDREKREAGGHGGNQTKFHDRPHRASRAQPSERRCAFVTVCPPPASRHPPAAIEPVGRRCDADQSARGASADCQGRPHTQDDRFSLGGFQVVRPPESAKDFKRLGLGHTMWGTPHL